MAESSILTTDLDDLRDFATTDGPFFAAVIPARSDVTDADHRFDIRWRKVRSGLPADWPSSTIEAVDARVAELRHDGGAALTVIASKGGDVLTEFLTASVGQVHTLSGSVPPLVPIIEGRQRTIPHVVVEADKSGADLVAFDGTVVLETEEVEGEVFQIHRGRFGGWSHRRFQQRAENTWDTNANDVADRTAALVKRVGAKMVMVSGPTRAQSMVVDELNDRHVERVIKLRSGDPDGVSDEVVTEVDTAHAAAIKDLAERYRTALANEGAVAGADATLDALAEGRVQTLLVTDDWTDEMVTDRDVGDVAAGARTIDAAVATALRTDADVVVVPTLGAMNGPLGALTRW